jgi:hypothetical protein
MTQNSYLKFPTSTIKSTDSVIGATLRLYKTGGDSGPVVVKLSSCSFKRSTLTYTSSHKLTNKQPTASTGASSKFPSASDVWVGIKLKAAVIQSARASGDHICFEVSGGGKSKPVILSSELTGKKPELKLEVQSPKPTAAAKKAAAKKKAVAKKDNKKEMAAQKKCATDEKARFTAEALKAKADAMQKKIAQIKADGARALARDTQGSKKNMVVAKEAAKEAATMQQKIKEKSEQIKSMAKANMEKALIASGTTGTARTNKK